MLPLPRARIFLLCCGLFCALIGGAVAQSITPIGTEFSLGGTLPGDQMLPAASLGADGGWLVWRDSRLDKTGTGIGARRIDSFLQGVGAALKVNNTTVGDQDRPAVALLNNGGAAIAWQSETVPGLADIYARFLTASGGFASAEIKVSSGTATLQRRYVTNMLAYLNNKLIKRRFAISEAVRVTRDLSGHPAIARLPDGSVVVAYDAVRTTRTNGWRLEQRVTTIGSRTYVNDVLRPFLQIGSWGHDVFIRRYSAAGKPLGAEVQVNQFAENHQRYPAITVLSNGNFVVAWVSEERVNNSVVGLAQGVDRVDIVARVFDPAAQPLGDEFTVNTSAHFCGNPSLAALPEGGFIAAWSEDFGTRPDSWDVFSRAFQADGSTTQQDAVRVNTFTVGDQFQPRVVTSGGEQMAVWTSLGQDLSWEGVYGRQLVGGVPVGDEFRVNTSTASKQFMPDIAGLADGRFLAVWSGIAQSTAFELFGQAVVCAPATGPAPAGLAAGDSALTESERSGSATIAPPLSSLPSKSLAVAAGVAGRTIRVGMALNRHARELRWNTSAGRIYQVQISTNLTDWANLGEPRTAAGASDTLALTGAQTVAFFRVIQVQ